MSVSDIPEKVRYLLWAKSAGRCQFEGCNEPLWRDGLTQAEMNFADLAHIIGDSPNGPRGHVVLSEEYCSDISNLMLLCRKHHKMIDEKLKVYTTDVLRKMKRVHEERIELLTAITPDKQSHVLIYRGGVGKHQPKVDPSDTWLAMFPEWYPSSKLPIELGLHNSTFQDSEGGFWALESENLERQFNNDVKPITSSDRERNHFSVFAVAPQPLLVKLGALFSDIYPAEVYQLHREPTTWQWQPGPQKFEYLIENPASFNGIPVLTLSLSATIDSKRIKKVFGKQKFAEWKVTIKNPNNDFLRSRLQLQMFRVILRKLLDKIKAKHGEDVPLHIFPAVPVSVAVEIGRVWQPKADLPMIIYDQNRKLNGFSRALTIGDVKND